MAHDTHNLPKMVMLIPIDEQEWQQKAEALADAIATYGRVVGIITAELDLSVPGVTSDNVHKFMFP